MAVESAADLAAFFDTAEFAVTATWQTAGGSADLPVIFDAEHLALASLAEVALSTASPQLLCRAADLPAGAAAGDTVTVAGASYVARDIRPDGTGVVTVLLEEA